MEKEELPSAIWSKALSERGQLKSVCAHFFIFSLSFSAIEVANIHQGSGVIRWIPFHHFF